MVSTKTPHAGPANYSELTKQTIGMPDSKRHRMLAASAELRALVS